VTLSSHPNLCSVDTAV